MADRALGNPLGNPLGLARSRDSGQGLIGSVQFFSGNPGGDYIPAVGGVFNKADYPKLYQHIGYHPGEGPITWHATGTPGGRIHPAADGFAVGADGVVFMMGNGPANLSLIRSSDNFRTCQRISIPGQVIRVWADTTGIVLVFASNILYRSADNGLTFSVITNPFGGSNLAAYCSNYAGVWVGVRNDDSGGVSIRVSTDGGLTFPVLHSFNSVMGLNDVPRIVFSEYLNEFYVGDTGTIVKGVFVNETLNFTKLPNVDGTSGYCMALPDSVVAIQSTRATKWVKGVGEGVRQIVVSPGVSTIYDSTYAVDEFGNVLVVTNTGSSYPSFSRGGGLLEKSPTSVSLPSPPGVSTGIVGYSKGEFIVGISGTQNIYIGAVTPQFDTSTQFFVPLRNYERNAYIRAR